MDALNASAVGESERVRDIARYSGKALTKETLEAWPSKSGDVGALAPDRVGLELQSKPPKGEVIEALGDLEVSKISCDPDVGWTGTAFTPDIVVERVAGLTIREEEIEPDDTTHGRLARAVV
jgi:hypothetical protein